MIKIRKAKKEDLELITELDIALAMEISKKDFWKKDEKIFRRLDKSYLTEDLKKNYMFFVAEDKEKMVGFVAGSVKKNPGFFKVKRYGFIREIYIRPSYRHKGFGQQLMGQMIRYFKSKKIKAVQLNVLSNNKQALKMYQSMGFKENRKKMVKKL
ncbi:GNAT family N-acetyltransferase [Nanoarchaeota archaeon]